MPVVAPVCGTLRGAGDENAGRCLCGVLVEGVGVAMVDARPNTGSDEKKTR
jgi:hypothetical protein